jgi:RNA polymerase primary sigma factor
MKRNLDVKRVGKFIENSQIMDAYYNDIRKYPQMSRATEIEVFNRLKNGDEKAREEIINANLRFVVSVAKKYVRKDEDLPDFINEGNIGLMEAIEKFDLERDVKFITFAVHYIEKKICEYQLDQPMIYQTNLNKTVYLLSKIKAKFLQQEMREPTSQEIIEILRNEYETEIFDEKDVYNLTIDSLDMNIDDDVDGFQINNEFDKKYYLNNYIESEIDKQYNKDYINKLMFILTNIERDIIKLYFGIGIDKDYTISEISNITGYVPERIRQIVESSILLMKSYYDCKKIV